MIIFINDCFPLIQKFRSALLLKHYFLLCQHSFCFIFLVPKSSLQHKSSHRQSLRGPLKIFWLAEPQHLSGCLGLPPSLLFIYKGFLFQYTAVLFHVLQFPSLPLNCSKTNLYMYVCAFCCARLM